MCFSSCDLYLSSHAHMMTIQFSSSFAITMMFPFAPFLVRFLLPQVKETDVGKHRTNVHEMCFSKIMISL